MKNNLSLFKDCLALYPSGITVVTMYDNFNNKMGVTISSFSSLSLEPELVMFAINNNSFIYSIIKKNMNICINILSVDQIDECISFTKPTNVNWQNINHIINNNFIHLAGSVAHIECSVNDINPAGDHSIIIAKANSYFFDQHKKPLIYHNRKFVSL